MNTRLWVDDIRLPPDDSWDWAKNVDQAQEMMTARFYEMVSLDHDLSEEHYTGNFSLAPCGYDLVKWMDSEGYWPPIVCLHTQNPVGRQNMRRVLETGGYRWNSSGRVATCAAPLDIFSRIIPTTEPEEKW